MSRWTVDACPQQVSIVSNSGFTKYLGNQPGEPGEISQTVAIGWRRRRKRNAHSFKTKPGKEEGRFGGGREGSRWEVEAKERDMEFCNTSKSGE